MTAQYEAMTVKMERIRQEIVGVVSVLGGLYLALCLATYTEWDPSLFVYTTLPTRNYGGLIGSYIADSLVAAVGLSAVILPVVLLVFGVKRLLGKGGHWLAVVGTLLLVLSLSVFLALAGATLKLTVLTKTGGAVGLLLSDLLVRLVSVPGAYIFCLALLLSSLIILSPVSLTAYLVGSGGRKDRTEETVYDGAPLPRNETAVIDVTDTQPLRPEPGLPLPDIRFSTDVQPPPGRKLREESKKQPVRDQGCAGKYVLPHLDLLGAAGDGAVRPTREELHGNAELLVKKLRDFDVEGRVTQIHSGPVVTMYEFEPAPGVKINRVVSLSDDLALSLKAQSIRVSALPNKAAIGVEVPNRNRETVCIREIISSDPYEKSHSKLTLALGKDIFGTPVAEDLARMPHLLVAGATGSGKSVSINSMVMSILFKATPEEVKMLMIDPKLLELSSYEKIPHLISPVITAPKEASEALRKMVFEMERRYRLLAERGVRNIESFNRMVSDEERLPYIIVFIDELADLMFASSNEVEDSIARLAQMARASGIHLIVATQRPSVDVITGVIKANFPARIAFHVTSRIDSRTIIDGQGAEQLLGKGDMLLMLPGMRTRRVHGALVTEEEVKAVTDFISSQGLPDYSAFESIQPVEAEQEDGSGERDDMYRKVLEFGDSMGEVSISSIQRRFKIGYNRAARIMELLEEDGLVGPPKGAGKPRDFLHRRR